MNAIFEALAAAWAAIKARAAGRAAAELPEGEALNKTMQSNTDEIKRRAAGGR